MIALLVLTLAGLTDPAARGVLREIAEAQRGVNALEARFVQEKHLDIVSDVLRSSGRLAVSRGRGVVWEVEEPEKLRVVVLEDGVYVGGKRLHDAAAGPALAHVGGLFTGISEEMTADFDVGLEPSDGLRLVPRRPGLARIVRSIVLRFDERKVPSAILLEEASGETSEIRLEDVVVNPTMPEGTFVP